MEELQQVILPIIIIVIKNKSFLMSQQSSNNSTQNKNTAGQQVFKQNFQKSKKTSQEYFRQLHQQIRILKQKNQRHDQEAEEKTRKIYKKSLIDKYTQDVEADELQIPVDGELQRGSKIFMINCAGCHSLEPTSGSTNKKGPALGLIYNRKAGADYQYQAYSDQMIKNQNYWSTRNLYKFMFDPQLYLKGTLCSISKQKGLKSEQDRADIIVFLREYSKQLGRNIQLKNIQAKGYGLAQTQIYVDEQKQKYIDKRIQKKQQYQNQLKKLQQKQQQKNRNRK